MSNRVALFVGTNKGGFILTSDGGREKWDVSGPHMRGSSVDHMVYDGRSGTVFMAVNHEIYGPEVSRSVDFGKTWVSSERNPRFEEDSGRVMEKLWNIHPGRDSEPGVVYLGAMPASLWRSDDDGVTWAENAGLQAVPSRPKWVPGAGGLCLHTIVLDSTNADRMAVGISAGGYFRTEDGGETWARKTDGLPLEEGPSEPDDPDIDYDADADHCVHKVAIDADDPSVQYMQHHLGVFRTSDFGDSWEDIGEGLPELFGFPVASHPRKSGHVWLIPNHSGEFRAASSGAFRVFKSESGGDSWVGKTDGLPQSNAYLSTLRESMAVDSCDSVGVYVGSKSGVLWGSRDEGESWYEVASSLPPILSVEAASVIGPGVNV
jgi:hypothetical protein